MSYKAQVQDVIAEEPKKNDEMSKDIIQKTTPIGIGINSFKFWEPDYFSDCSYSSSSSSCSDEDYSSDDNEKTYEVNAKEYKMFCQWREKRMMKRKYWREIRPLNVPPPPLPSQPCEFGFQIPHHYRNLQMPPPPPPQEPLGQWGRRINMPLPPPTERFTPWGRMDAWGPQPPQPPMGPVGRREQCGPLASSPNENFGPWMRSENGPNPIQYQKW